MHAIPHTNRMTHSALGGFFRMAFSPICGGVVRTVLGVSVVIVLVSYDPLERIVYLRSGGTD